MTLHGIIEETLRIRRERGYRDSYYSVLRVAAAVYAKSLGGK
jgi:hypothetical protein